MSSLLLLFLSFFCLTALGLRNYTFGVKVALFGGSRDTIHVHLCHANTTNCLDWYKIDGGLSNGNQWYYFMYPEQPDIGNIEFVDLYTTQNDQLCVSQISVAETKYEANNGNLPQCMEVSDSKPPNSCDVITVDLSTSAFTGNLYDGPECANNVDVPTVDNTYTAPPVTTANGTRTYEIVLTVSSLPFSGTNSPMYVRMCNDWERTDCTKQCDEAMTVCTDEWFVWSDGVRDEGYEYTEYWNTIDIGNVSYVDLVQFGADQFCLSQFGVDTFSANAGSAPECIGVDEDDTGSGCATLGINLQNADMTSTSVNQCSYGIKNNDTTVPVDEYEFTFKIGASPFCGADFSVFFIFCTADGGVNNTDLCSKVYEIEGQMPSEGASYSFTVDVSQLSAFNTLKDVLFVDVFSYSSELWCLSDITINGMDATGETLNGPNADSTPANVIESSIEDGAYCDGARIYMQNNQWQDFVSSYNITCRWNDKKNSDGTVKVSLFDGSCDFFCWIYVGNNWIILSVCIISFVACCICGCAIGQKFRKKSNETHEDGVSWHGGNSAF